MRHIHVKFFAFTNTQWARVEGTNNVISCQSILMCED